MLLRQERTCRWKWEGARPVRKRTASGSCREMASYQSGVQESLPGHPEYSRAHRWRRLWEGPLAAAVMRAWRCGSADRRRGTLHTPRDADKSGSSPEVMPCSRAGPSPSARRHTLCSSQERKGWFGRRDSYRASCRKCSLWTSVASAASPRINSSRCPRVTSGVHQGWEGEDA